MSLLREFSRWPVRRMDKLIDFIPSIRGDVRPCHEQWLWVFLGCICQASIVLSRPKATALHERFPHR
jgi:hypothetical protein